MLKDIADQVVTVAHLFFVLQPPVLPRDRLSGFCRKVPPQITSGFLTEPAGCAFCGGFEHRLVFADVAAAKAFFFAATFSPSAFTAPSSMVLHGAFRLRLRLHCALLLLNL